MADKVPKKTPIPGHHSLSVNSGAKVSATILAISESHYLIDSNREKCKTLFSKHEWQHGELIDGYIALHIVLEAGFNSLFRQLALRSLKKGVDRITVMKNVDEVSFIHKTTLFIYNSKFNFEGRETEATDYHKIIGTLKSFCSIRNSLLHGHAIATVSGTEIPEPQDTVIRKSIVSGKKVKEQLNRFRFIMDGMTFYIDCLDDLSDEDRNRYKSAYLGYDFLPKDFI